MEKQYIRQEERQENTGRDYYTVDLKHIFKSLWKRAWVIALVGFLCAILAFSYAAFLITPTYSSSIMLYVNNSSFSLGNTNFSITSSEITAAQSLVKTYAEILNNRTTLERVIIKSRAPYTTDQLSDMIVAAPSNETEIMRVTVTTDDPYQSSSIANTIAEILPVRIAEIIDGASMEVVDSAIPNLNKVAPSITRYTAVGMFLGILLSAIGLAIAAIMDDTIHDEEYIIQTYNYPILAKVPDLLNTGGKRYGYYYRYKSKSKN